MARLTPQNALFGDRSENPNYVKNYFRFVLMENNFGTIFDRWIYVLLDWSSFTLINFFHYKLN